MKPNTQKIIPYLIVIVLLIFALLATYLFSYFSMQKVDIYLNSAKERSFHEMISRRKESSDLYVKEMDALFNKRYSQVETKTREELRAKITVAYKTARFLYEKYKGKKSNTNIKERIIDALRSMQYCEDGNYIFITDYRANSILLGKQNIDKKSLASYVDDDYRSIILEEIQKVRRHKEGYIKSRDAKTTEQEIIFVKDLGAFDWFLGTSMQLQTKAKEIQTELIDMVRSLPIDKSNFMLLFDENKNSISAKKGQEKLHDNMLEHIQKNLTKELMWHEDKHHNYYYLTSYNTALNFYFVYGFKESLTLKEVLH